MELVDGENLASLLRRIGRLPPDKALEIARQLCAGLAAAHEKGVLHRDLKPANVMLDGQGNVRITDFGLAGLAESLRHGDVRSGTPCYMSPEQLQGREVTVSSDIYSLGLVLYELYTGRRAFEGKSLAEYTGKHRDERPIEPSALVAGLDPAVERAILSCLEKEPRRRPSSPHVVAAMLTGRDPLEAALAAGETPSPEIVAAAGETHGLPPALAWGLLGLTLIGLALVPLTGSTLPAAGDGSRRQAAGGARGPRARLRPAHGAGSPGRGRHLGPRRGMELHGLRGRRRTPRSAAGATSPTAIRPCSSSGTARARGRSCRCSRAARCTG